MGDFSAASLLVNAVSTAGGNCTLQLNIGWSADTVCFSLCCLPLQEEVRSMFRVCYKT